MYVRNIGHNDRIVRFFLAIILIVIVAFVDFNLVLRWALGIVGVILFITAFVMWCPIYSIVNHSSRGQGLDKITQRDIQEAVKDYSLKTPTDKVEVDIQIKEPDTKALVTGKTKKKQETTNKTTKKAIIKKKGRNKEN